jgi:hypothetical protein
MKSFGRIARFFIFITAWSSFATESYVIGDILGQLGNNLFQVAVASAVAWDNGSEAYFPRLAHTPILCQHVFSRVKLWPPSNEVDFEWNDPGHYELIPFMPRMKINGYLQSPKYFAHHRERLLALFAPTARDQKYIEEKYGWLIDHPNTVGVQIRYWIDDVGGNSLIQYGQDYLNQAKAQFPDDSLFIVSSNNREFAKQNFSAKNAVFLEEPFYIEFYLLTKCRHIIVTNSTFGWWAAWLNQNPNQRVVCPTTWFSGYDKSELCPDTWIQVYGKLGRISDADSYR